MLEVYHSIMDEKFQILSVKIKKKSLSQSLLLKLVVFRKTFSPNCMIVLYLEVIIICFFFTSFQLAVMYSITMREVYRQNSKRPLSEDGWAEQARHRWSLPVPELEL